MKCSNLKPETRPKPRLIPPLVGWEEWEASVGACKTRVARNQFAQESPVVWWEPVTSQGVQRWCGAGWHIDPPGWGSTDLRVTAVQESAAGKLPCSVGWGLAQSTASASRGPASRPGSLYGQGEPHASLLALRGEVLRLCSSLPHSLG